MGTKFILNGGTVKDTPNNPEFYREILKDAPQNAKVLIVPFAKETERIAITTERERNELDKHKWQEKLNFVIANEENFIEQVKSSDVIYFQGGTSLKLLETLKKFPQLKNILKGKTVAGESAGANVLCKFFFSPRSNSISEGLDLLPVKLIPHYKDEYKNTFTNISPEVDTLLLKEHQSKIFNID